MPRRVQAIRDPSLSARVMRQTPLCYCDGPDDHLDRPAHVRAGSSLAWCGERLGLVQDDANFFALIDPHAQRVEAVPLPCGEGGFRQFDDLRATKHLKLDLEACVAATTPEGEIVLAFGSGSTPLRETIAEIHLPPSCHVALYPAPAFYRALRERLDFAGSELNLEGAVLIGDRLRFFNRGNGAPRGDLLPLNATVDVEFAAFLAWLRNPSHAGPPILNNVVQYDLGELGGQPLGFTDAAVTPWGLLYSATAEDSPDAVQDGHVTGSALGVFDGFHAARWIELRTADGALFVGKVEGVCACRERPNWVYLVIDADDPQLPSELCEVELSGF